MLRERVLLAAVGLPLTLLAVIYGGVYLAALIAVAGLAGLRELHLAVGAVRPGGLPLTARTAAAAVIAATCWASTVHPGEWWWTAAALVFFGGVWIPVIEVARSLRAPARGQQATLRRLLSATASGWALLLSLALPLSLVLVGRGHRHGMVWLLTLLVTVWMNDMGGYFIGRWRGERQLTAHISPNKTVEGAVGGLLAAAAAAPVTAGLLGPVSAGALWPQLVAWVVFGLLVGAAAQAGDLLASAVKRRAGTKDFGRWLPGHGGMMDRIDSLLVAAPAAYALLLVAGGWLF